MARWQESYSVGDTVEYSVPACGWHRGRIVRKTRSGIPVVKCADRSIWVATRKTDIRRVAGPADPIDIDRLIYEAVAAERQRCAEKCQAIMNRHIDEIDRKRHVEDRSVEAAMALGAAECREALSPYVVRDMSDEKALYPTFAEALTKYQELRERIRGRANIVNKDECDGATDGNPDGLTDDEREQL